MRPPGKFPTMSTAEMIYEKSKTLPDSLQAEALHFVDYLARRRDAKNEAEEWGKLFRKTQALDSARSATDADISAEVAAIRART